MSFFHGLRASEIATSLTPTAETVAGLPVVVGTAPIHLTENPTKNKNKAVMCQGWDEAVAEFGYSADWDKYTLNEVMFSEFKLYGNAPVVFINVLDADKHKTSIKDTRARKVNENREIVVNDSVLISSLKISNILNGINGVDDDIDDDIEDSDVTVIPAAIVGVINEDYTAAFNDEGELVITLLENGNLSTVNEVYIAYDKLDPSKVTYLDIIGGVNSSGVTSGLELVDMVFTLTGNVPGIILSPGFSQNPTVASVMKAKAKSICDVFDCIVLTDIDTEVCKNYTDVLTWKSQNNYTGENQYNVWPCFENYGMIFRGSTHALGVIRAMDAENEDVPYDSPSNRELQVTGMCLKNGTEVNLTLKQANLLNEQGVATGLNFRNGWYLWGNYTGVYPTSTDPKDCFLCVRRMFNWQKATFILTNWNKVDRPLLPRIINSLADSESIRLNGLVARGFLLSANVEFRVVDNPTTDLLAGKFRLRVKMAAPIPAQDIEEMVEYDVNAYSELLADLVSA